jgi:TolB-like protein/DNA-binding winged helix-turn-helix (wHTH) protein
MQAGPNNGPSRLRFGVFEVDISTKELYKRGLRVRLENQPFQILFTLVRQPGKVVTREELQRNLWSANTFVEFDEGLNTAIKKLRYALGDSAGSPRFSETLPRLGYRFIAPVERLQPESVRALPVEPMVQKDGQPGAELLSVLKHRRLVPALPARLVGIGAALLAIAVVLGWRGWPWRTVALTIRSVAVLPLEDLAADPAQEYFSDGMTDELIIDLGKITELRVVSRTSVMQYKRVHKPLAQIARELNVDAVLEGTVLRSGNRVRITAQLIQARSDKHLWAESYEGDLLDVLELQEEVASAIAGQIRVRLSPQERVALKTGRVVSREGHEAYLKGSYFAEKRTADGLTKAISYFEEAIHDDPNFALPYAGLAQAYSILPDYVAASPREAYRKARLAAAKALELDDRLAEAHAALGVLLGNAYD